MESVGADPTVSVNTWIELVRINVGMCTLLLYVEDSDLFTFLTEF